jgi:drug/metabolite transporter (DMT)-like permease
MTRQEVDVTRGITLAFGAAVISGFSVFINSYAVRAVPDATVYTTAKNLVAAVVLIGLALLVSLRSGGTAGGVTRLPRSPQQVAGLLVVAIVGGSVPFVLFFEGLARASSSHAAFIHKTLVVWVVLLAIPLLGETIKALHLVAFGLLLGGLVILDNGLAGFAFGNGEVLVFLATLLWAGEVVLVKRLLRSIAPSSVAVARMGLGVVTLLAWVAVSGRWSTLVALDATGWGWALLTGVILAAYVTTWFTSLSLAPAIDVTAILVVGAVITALLAAMVKGTPIPGLNAAGLLLVTAAAVIVAAIRVTRTQPVAVSR